MNWIRKINRGLVLTLLILIGIVVYLSWLGASRRDDLPVLRDKAAAYLEAELVWSQLPEVYRTAHPTMPAAELAAFADAQADVIEGWYIDHDAIVDPLVGRMRENLAKQAAGQDVFLSYTKEILKVEDILFDTGRATVSLTVRTRLEVAGRQGIYAEDMADTVILQKEDGVWRVVYAQLNKPTAWQYEKEDYGGYPAPGFK
ncbi:MAG: hypothetical protein GX153_00455 [Clostridiaceae bacterium]|jgi:hypothetical protein|nr:hypothetical protein [Clostridiaceae bacterium]